MSTALENQPFWPQIVSDLKKKKLRDLAKEHRVPVADLQKALERAGLLPGATNKKVQEAPKPAETPARASSNAAQSDGRSTRRGGATAKLESIRDQLGKVADGVLAERLGIARKTVVEFRKKNNIGAFAGSRQESQAKPAPAPAAEPKRRGRPPKDRSAQATGGSQGTGGAQAQAAPKSEAPAVAPKRRGRPPKNRDVAPVAAAPAPAASEGSDSTTGRASKLDAFRDIIGKVPDREVSERTGMTTENVRMYRQRRGIAAMWREKGAESVTAAPSAKAGGTTSSAAASGGRSAGASGSGGSKGAASGGGTSASAASASTGRGSAAESRGAKASSEGTGRGGSRKAEAPAPRKRGRQPAAPGESKVEKALAVYRDDIGRLPDAELATKAGVSRSAVSAYRQKYKIKASGKGGRPPKNRGGSSSAASSASSGSTSSVQAARSAPAARSEGTRSATQAPSASSAAPITPPRRGRPPKNATSGAGASAGGSGGGTSGGSSAGSSSASTGGGEASASRGASSGGQRSGSNFVYRITALKDGEKRTFALVAPDPVEAVRRAHDHFTKGKWVIRDVRLIAEALPD
jgi:hypothetical protein